MLSKINAFSAKYLIAYYFLLSSMDGLFLMLGMPSLVKLNMIMVLMAIPIAMEQLLKKRRGIDWFIFGFIIIVTISSLCIHYDSALFYFGFRYQLLLMLLFWVGESRYMADWKLFDKAKIPIVVTAIMGLVLFFFPPDWYISYKFSVRDKGTDEFFLELTRLSAFWIYPYWISYGCGILYYYILCRLYMLGKSIRKKEVWLMCFLLLIIILSQQRAPFFFVLMSTVILGIVSLKGQSERQKYFRNRIVLMVLILSFSSYFLISFLDTERLDFMLDKVVALNSGGNDNFIERRFKMFSDVGGGGGFTLFGQGIGRFSHAAYNLGKLAVTDNQIYAIYLETGYVGCIGYALIIGTVLIKGMKQFKYNIFELGIVLFYLMAMTGANPLNIEQEHTLVFWICCGRIFNKDCLAYKKAELGRIRN